MPLISFAPEALKPVKSSPSAVGFVLIVAAILLAVAVLSFLIPMMVSVAGVLLSLVPVLLIIAGLYSCVVSLKPTNIKLLWILIIVLAPVLGPILWFLWGKQNT